MAKKKIVSAKKDADVSVKTAAPQSKKNLTWLYLICIILTGVIAYSNSFDCSFHFDDLPNIRDNKIIRKFDIVALWEYSHNRFLPFVSFAMDYHFHQLDLWGYHLVNLIIHLLSSIVVFGLTRTLFDTPAMKSHPLQSSKNSIAFFAALLFVAHPLATQSVTYLVQRLASMVALFYLLSLFLFIKARISKGVNAYLYYVAMVVAACSTLVSKENGYTLPLAIGLTELIFFRDIDWKTLLKKQSTWLVLILIAGFGVFVLTRFGSEIKTRTPQFTNEFREITPFSYLFTQFTIIPKYIQLLFLPVNQNLDYDWPLYHSLFQWQVLMGLLLILGLLLLGVYQWNRNKLYAFGIFFFFLAMLVESSIVPIDDLIFEHRTYLPSFGFFLVLSFFLHGLWYKTGNVLKYGLIVFITMAFTFASYERNKVWKDELTLSRDRMAKSPGKGRSHVALAGSLFESITDLNDQVGNALVLEEAKEHALKAMMLWPKDEGPRQSLGIYYYFKGKYDSAYFYQASAVESEKENQEYRQNLLKTLNKLKRYDEAIIQANFIMKKDSTNETALFGLALAYTNQNKLKEGLNYFLKLAELTPNRADVLQYISQIYKVMGNMEESKKYELRASGVQ
jgi:tetratricopeptide (TPR) repeat protein